MPWTAGAGRKNASTRPRAMPSAAIVTCNENSEGDTWPRCLRDLNRCNCRSVTFTPIRDHRPCRSAGFWRQNLGTPGELKNPPWRSGNPRELGLSLRSYQSGPRKDLAMIRLLSILAFGALCILPVRASADQLKPHESLASEISSRQRCACTWRGPTRIIRHKRYRSAYLTIGYNPLPYRFGTATVWGPPYRYYWR